MTKPIQTRSISLSRYKEEVNDADEIDTAKKTGPRDRVPSGLDIRVPYDGYEYEDDEDIIQYHLIGFSRLRRPANIGDDANKNWINAAIFSASHPDLDKYLKDKLGKHGWEFSYAKNAAVRLGTISYCNAVGFPQFQADYQDVLVNSNLGPVKALVSLLLDGPFLKEAAPMPTQEPAAVTRIMSREAAKEFYGDLYEDGI